MMVDAYLVEILTEGIPHEMLVDYYEYNDVEIENALLYLHTPLPKQYMKCWRKPGFSVKRWASKAHY